MNLTVIHEGKTESGLSLLVGDTCEYRGHIPGGMVKVFVEDGEHGREDVAHPACFKELQ